MGFLKDDVTNSMLSDQLEKVEDGIHDALSIQIQSESKHRDQTRIKLEEIIQNQNVITAHLVKSDVDRLEHDKVLDTQIIDRTNDIINTLLDKFHDEKRASNIIIGVILALVGFNLLELIFVMRLLVK